jgi:hypothetical protein
VDESGAVAEVPDLAGRVLALVATSRTARVRMSYEIDGDPGDATTWAGSGTFTVDLPVGAREVALKPRGSDEIPEGAAVGFGFYVRAD